MNEANLNAKRDVFAMVISTEIHSQGRTDKEVDPRGKWVGIPSPSQRESSLPQRHYFNGHNLLGMGYQLSASLHINKAK